MPACLQRMRHLSLLCAAILLPAALFAQPAFEPLWANLYLDEAEEIAHSCFGIAQVGDSILLMGDRGVSTLPILMWLSADGELLDTTVVYPDHYLGVFRDGVLTRHGTVLLCGSYPDSVIGHTDLLGCAAELALDGTVLWDRTYRFPDCADQRLRAACQTAGGDYVFVGGAVREYPPSYIESYWWVRTDSLGNLLDQDTLWFHRNTVPDAMEAYAVAPTADGGVVLAGHSLLNDSGTELVRLDAACQYVWHTLAGWFGGFARIHGVAERADGTLAVVATVFSGPNRTGRDIVVERYAATGQRLWQRALPAPQQQWGEGGVVLTREGWILAVGKTPQLPRSNGEFLASLEPDGRVRAVATPNNEYDPAFLAGAIQLPDCSYVVAGVGAIFYGSPWYIPRLYAARYGPDRSQPQPPAPCHLLAPANGDTLTGPEVTFRWTAAADPDPYDEVRYNLVVWTSGAFVRRDDLPDTCVTLPVEELRRLGAPLWWGIEASSGAPDSVVGSAEVWMVWLPPLPAAEPRPVLPAGYELTAYPNPFNAALRVRFTLPHTGNVRLVVHDVTGREVTRTDLPAQAAGEHEWRWEPEGLGAGLYFVTVHTDNARVVTKALLLR